MQIWREASGMPSHARFVTVLGDFEDAIVTVPKVASLMAGVLWRSIRQAGRAVVRGTRG